VYLVDVAGHGIASAVNSLLFHRFLSPVPGREGLFPLLGADPLFPDQVVEKLEERFCAGGDAPCFSILYGILDLESGAVRIARRGQPHPVLQRKDGSVEIVTAQSNGLGKGEGRRSTEQEVRLEKGDRLYLFSDGLVECAGSDMEQFSGARLISLLEGLRGRSLEETTVAVDAEILKWRGRDDFDDDVCLMAVQLE
jgi:sigma-B regulation protein RsbU (phosphoserine phosphatase)